MFSSLIDMQVFNANSVVLSSPDATLFGHYNDGRQAFICHANGPAAISCSKAGQSTETIFIPDGCG